MKRYGKLKKLYAGANTCDGFYSLYHNILRQEEATRLYIIKGGPGVGKSTFMKYISKKIRNKGFDVEHFYCSSDNDSLDGLVIPALKIGIVDGTAPHLSDPKTPGAVDKIIDLGNHWDESKLRSCKKEIMSTAKEDSRCFQTAYYSLKQAKISLMEWEGYISGATSFHAINKITNEMISDIFKDVDPNYINAKAPRELFAGAITPSGFVNEWANILADCKDAYLLKGEPGTGKSSTIERIIMQAKAFGIETEVYRCPFDPQKYEGVYLPKLKIAVVSLQNSSFTVKSNTNINTINFNNHLELKTINKYSDSLSEVKEGFTNAIIRAIKYIANAKLEHDKLEGYYIPSMIFSEIDIIRDEVLEEILDFAR